VRSIAGRYRLVALLGRGGMGEVYRADDLVLDQPVALKFLPQGVAANAARLTQFHNELRVARQVSHKNACRLYDLGEADGRPFLTMEYVDGENLSGLLRRIGRFPQDRAVAIARQLCAGVAAAHERGVIHRDLKPANVMIDGEGNVRITDFGIATAASDVGAELVGTPQYMAPEQLKGQPASPRTDIYSLGLILFEVFTGKRAYDANTLNELKAQHDTGVLTTPSNIVRDLDPAIESVILRCMSKDPQGRPGTALAVAAALPGADPLAAALAAGETPSPDLVAAAGEREALPVVVGLACVAWILAGLWAAAAVAPRLTFARLAALDKPPAVLADRAEQILVAFGYTEPRAATAHGFQLIGDYIDWIARTDQRPQRWMRLGADSPAALLYWYRTSPRTMVPRQLALRVTPNDPALNDTNMHVVVLDMRGRLLQLNSVPPAVRPRATKHGSFGTLAAALRGRRPTDVHVHTGGARMDAARFCRRSRRLGRTAPRTAGPARAGGSCRVPEPAGFVQHHRTLDAASPDAAGGAVLRRSISGCNRDPGRHHSDAGCSVSGASHSPRKAR
jgi:serine/threonine-protein kinase